jgi:hypothetical protein
MLNTLKLEMKCSAIGNSHFDGDSSFTIHDVLDAAKLLQTIFKAKVFLMM